MLNNLCYEKRLTVAECAIFAGVSKLYIYRLIKDGKLKSFKSCGVTFILFSDIEKLKINKIN